MTVAHLMDCGIGIMAKAPIPGHAKTRLIPLLGSEGAAAVQENLIHRALATAWTAKQGAVTLFTDGAPEHPLWQECQRRYGVPCFEQQGEDLGQRMVQALHTLLTRYSAAVLIGTDCPVLSAVDLREAISRIPERGMTFIPAEDGGYVLVGGARIFDAAFQDIAWSTAAVMEQTRAHLRAVGAQPERDWTEGTTLWDVDVPADFERACALGLLEAEPRSQWLPMGDGVAIA
jgi:rSAM/selenodomain-associated transferase 1